MLMDVTPGGPTKRPRAKTKQSAQPEAAKPQGQPSIVIKKSRAPRKAAVPTVAAKIAAPLSDLSEAKAPVPSGDEIKGLIATEAYYLAAQRNFSPGHELDDWLEAERRVYANIFG
jgi:hypothetical protein